MQDSSRHKKLGFRRMCLLALVLAAGTTFVGCQGDTSGTAGQGGAPGTLVIGSGSPETATTPTSGGSTTVVPANPETFGPAGNIQVTARDAVSGLPLIGARVTVGNGPEQVTGNGGVATLSGIPASLWSDNNADGAVQLGELQLYTVIVDFRPVNDALPADAPRYPTTAFGQVAIGFANFLDGSFNSCAPGTGAGGGAGGVGGAGGGTGGAGGAGGAGGGAACVESGSGASTPINGLTSTIIFDIGALTDSIEGIVRDPRNGAYISGATVRLFDVNAANATPFSAGVRLTIDPAGTMATTDEFGFFRFENVSARHTYCVEVEATGFRPTGTDVGNANNPFPNNGTQAVGVPNNLCTTTQGNGSRSLLGPYNQSGLPPFPAEQGEIYLTPNVPTADVFAPWVTAATPVDGAVLDVSGTALAGTCLDEVDPLPPQCQAIVLTFNEAMQNTAFQPPIVAVVDFNGLPTGSVNDPAGTPPPAGGLGNAQVQVVSSFNEDNTVLTIRPINPWEPGLTYGVAIDGAFTGKPANLLAGNPVITAMRGFGAMVDQADNPCCQNIATNALGFFDKNNPASPIGAVFGEATASPGVLLFTTTDNPTPPGAPTVTISGGDFRDASTNVSWTAVDGARAYRVYMSIANGRFQLIAQTAPGLDPVRTMPRASWNMNLALFGRAGIDPLNAAGFGGTAQAGFDGRARNVLESFIPDVGDSYAAPAIGAAPGSQAGDADLSDNFGANNEVRLAVSAVNSNGVEGPLSAPMALRDTTGPTTNQSATFGGPLVLANGANPGANSGRGQVLQDNTSTEDVNGNGVLDAGEDTNGDGVLSILPGQDGIPDTIVIGLSEPLDRTTAETLANYRLLSSTGLQPARLANITITSATLTETDTNGDAIITPDEDVDRDGILDNGNNVDGPGNAKGNLNGNAYVTLRIAPAPGGIVDIRAGDYVFISTTTVRDLAGNANRAVDVGRPENRLLDITLPQVASAAFTDNTAEDNAGGILDQITISFNEPMNGLAGDSNAGNITVMIAGAACAFGPTPAFTNGNISRTLRIASADQACDLSRLRAGDFIMFGAGVTDAFGNGLDPAFDTLVYDGTNFVRAADIPEDFIVPRVASASVTVRSDTELLSGMLDQLVVTFSERLGNANGGAGFGQATLMIAGQQCPVTVAGSFLRGDTQVRFNVVRQAAPSPCFIGSAGGNAGNLGLNDTLALSAFGAMDTSGNLLHPLFDTLVHNGTAFAVANDVPALDVVPPQLASVAIQNNAAGNDTMSVTFSERIGTFTLAQVMFTVGAQNCSAALSVGVGQNPQPFIPGATTISFTIDVANFAACDLANVAANDFIAFGPPTTGPAVTDIANNPIDNNADHAIRNAGNTAYIPNNDTQP